ncbi:trk system potassium uptake protein TrkA [Hasllibacter halocynthiae]|uniref:Trk system potassium uptake protein TrkA n=1 Tax=Hasllibacter halocynthiae TaxID=595589 RepID=A0A2T0X1V6_9RHOB|nr:TrkA family potassium uptake protein [Hasllibacter halocynthiae]PRY92920.1 trk system potassium uptake protein TrkA [Hasllibacter halocynthiae]
MARRSFTVIGLGAFGRTVALELRRFGNHVTGIDAKEGPVNDLADALSQAVIADARSDDALREAGVADADVAVIGMASDLESSVMAAINCRLLGVPTVWAKATSRTHHRILSKLGVDRIIHPEEEVGRHLAQVLHNPLVRDYLSLGNGYTVVNFTVPDALRGRGVGALHLERRQLRCLGVMRGTEYVGSDVEPCTLEADDRLLLLGRRQDLRDFAAAL